MKDEEASNRLSLKEALEFYENGKHRRYSLLFAVNGGAFAIAELMDGDKKLGGLSIELLSVGMFVLTIVLVADIWIFGQRSRKNPYFSLLSAKNGPQPDLFGRVGKIVLALIGLFLTTGWLLVAFGSMAFAGLAVVFLGALIAVLFADMPVEEMKQGPPASGQELAENPGPGPEAP
jgi:hypothetical protein